MAKKDYELRATYGDNKSRKVAESDSPEALRRQEQELRGRRKTGSSTFYNVRKTK